jgi:transcriptional regulator of acetoin/glycerol metabolism
VPADAEPPRAIARPPSSSPPRPLSSEDEARKGELVLLLRAHGGNVTAVARAMGKERMQIQRWIKRYGIDPRP